MTVLGELIKDRVRADADPASINLLAGMIEDRLRADATIADVDGLIAMARREWSPLFVAPVPVAPVTTTPSPVGTPAQQQRQARQADALDAALARCGGNPYRAKNVTVAALLEARDPARAARLKAEAA